MSEESDTSEPINHDTSGEDPPRGEPFAAEPDSNPAPESPSGSGGSRPPRMTRPESSRLLLGVGEGLGRYFGIDPTFARIGLIVTVFFGGIGLIAYLALALFVPSGDDPDAPDLKAPYQERPWLGAIGGAILILALFPSLHGGFWWGFQGLFWLLLLAAAGFGVYRWLKSRSGGNGRGGGEMPTPRPSSAVPTVATPVGELSDVSAEATTATYTATDDPGAAAAVAEETESALTPGTPSPRRRGNFLGVAGIVVGSFLAFAGAALVAALGQAEGIAIALAVAGVILVAAGIAGRLRWLTVPVLVAVLGVTLVVATGFELTGGFGDFNRTPGSAEEIPEEGYRIGAGVLAVDLRELDWGETPVLPLEVSAGVAQVVVLVDEEVCVSGRLAASLGKVAIGGEVSEGAGVESEPFAVSTATPRLEIDGRVTFGELLVISGSEDPPRSGDSFNAAEIDMTRQRDIRQAACSQET